MKLFSFFRKVRSGTVTGVKITDPIRFQAHKVPVDYQETQRVFWVKLTSGRRSSWQHVDEAVFKSVAIGDTLDLDA